MPSLPYIAPQYQLSPTAKKANDLTKQLNSLKSKYEGINGINARLERNTVDSAEYKKALAEKKDLDKKVAAIELQLAKNSLPNLQERLAKARNAGNTEEVNRIQEQISNANGVVSRNGATDPLVTGPSFVDGDTFGNAIREKGLGVVTDNDGKSYVSSSLAGYEGNNSEHFVYTYTKPTASGAPSRQSDIAYSYTEIEKKILAEEAKKPGGIDAFLNRLYKTGLIEKQTVTNRLLESDDFTGALRYVLKEYTKKTVRDYEVNGVKDPITFDEYLNREFKPEGPKTNYSAQVTTRDTAASDLDRFFIQYVGRSASKEEHDNYYKQLRAAEKKAVVATTSGETSTTRSGEYLDASDILELQRKVAGKALANTDIDTVLKSGAGAAQSVNEVLSYAKNYGVTLSPKDAMSYVADQLKVGQADPQAIKSKLLAISKATYTNLSDSLSDQVSLKELSGNYIYDMSRVLELNQDSIDVLDPTIQAALKNNGNKGMMNLTEFDKMLRNDKRWSKTRNAREEAANYAYDILQDFGLMA